MTKINKLVMKGFKSFAKRTEFEFGNTFNCVLGPNGSGKSNLLDALTFVLGRRSSKAMRAEKAANLIYNGGKKKNPSKEAIVSIHFDNAKKTFPLNEKEIIVSRILKPSGNSKYKINNKTKTRTEVLELLSHGKIDPDGYNIILQGDIVRFCQMPGEERRQIVEEIAGISQYEERKLKSIRELDRVNERIKEADIVLAERKTYLKELKKERDQAIEYKQLNTDLQKHKATLATVRINKHNKNLSEIEEKLNKFNTQIKEHNDVIETSKKEIDTLKAEMKKINDEIERKGEKEQVELNRKIEGLKVEMATNKTKIDSYKNEIQRLKDRHEALSKDNKDANEKLKSIDREKKDLEKSINAKQADLTKIEKEIENFRKKNKFDTGDLHKEVHKLDEQADKKDEEIQKLRHEQQEILREKDQMEFKLNEMQTQFEKVVNLQKENKAQLARLRSLSSEVKELDKKIKKLIDEDQDLVTKLRSSREEYSEATGKLARLEAKSAQIKERSMADQAISTVMSLKKQVKGIHGTVSDLGSVKSKYALALEMAAGGRIKHVVVEDDKVAEKCINHLKKSKAGSATFLPLNKIKSRPISNKSLAKGTHGFAIDLVDYDKKFKSVFELALGDTLVVDDIPAARKIGIGKVRMVTLEGDLIEGTGAMRGGYNKKRASLGFGEKEVSKGIGDLNERVASLQSSIGMYERKRLEVNEKLNKFREQKASVEGEQIKLERSLHLEGGQTDGFKDTKAKLQQNLKDADKRLQEVVKEISKLNKELTDVKIKRQQSRNKINEMRNPTLIAQMTAFEEKRTELRESIVKLETELKNLTEQSKNILGPEAKKVLKIIEENEKEEKKFTKLIDEFNDKLKKQAAELKVKEKDAKEFYQQFKGLFSKRDQKMSEVQKIEKKIDSKDILVKGTEQKLNALNIDATKIKAQLAGLNEEMEHYKDVEVFKTKTNEQELQSTISSLGRKQNNIGNVNLKALEVYEEIEKEYNALLEKKVTLETEKDDVHKMIDEIESSKTQIFMRTFNVVNDVFKQFFKKLSTKGEAYMEIENNEKPFDAGVDIKVKLSSKKFMDIKSLSGGEKTLTALAFIFAIQEHDPAMFYIMDEVDAALDKHNSEKLADLIRNYAGRAQYIVISHNDAVISEADKLYGVSMNEHGMSHITTLEL